MNRPSLIVLSCACALILALFGLSACGGASSDSSSSSSSSAAPSDAGDTGSVSSVDPENATAADFSEDEIRQVFEQLMASMSEFYKGTTPVGEEIYYAGGADGDNAVLAIIVPDSTQSIMFVGPASVGEDNRLTITDETTGSTITFSVTANGDDTFSFSMNEQSGSATMTRCSASDIVDVLAKLVSETASAANGSDTASGDASQSAQPAEGTQ